jgi:hypothetical protein
VRINRGHSPDNGQPGSHPGQESACRKFHHIGNNKRACVDESSQVPGSSAIRSNPRTVRRNGPRENLLELYAGVQRALRLKVKETPLDVADAFYDAHFDRNGPGRRDEVHAMDTAARSRSDSPKRKQRADGVGQLRGHRLRVGAVAAESYRTMHGNRTVDKDEKSVDVGCATSSAALFLRRTL